MRRYVHRVVAWEPVPHFRDYLKYGIAVNGFGNLIAVRRSLHQAAIRQNSSELPCSLRAAQSARLPNPASDWVSLQQSALQQHQGFSD